jgi:hypothetical protein
VGDYERELCRPLAAPLVESNELRFQAKIEDGSFDAKRCERLVAQVTNAEKHAFLVGNPVWCASQHWRERTLDEAAWSKKAANPHRPPMAAQSPGIVN